MVNKKVIPVWVSVVLLVLSVAGIGYYVFDAFRLIPSLGFSSTVVTYAVACVCFALAVIYCIFGYTKNASGIFKAYCVAMTVSYLIIDYVSAPHLVNGGICNTIMFFGILIQCGIWFVLTLARDLGKKKSLCLCAILLLIQIINMIIMATISKNMMIGSAVGIVAYVVSFIMFYGKYKDKAARGTK